MNQEKIGKFISQLRKEKKMTQLELAEKLRVTDRSVSNWENGKCMPDLSLFKPLCEELGISMNELLSGEKLKKEDYQERFEENMVNTINYTNKKINQQNSMLGITLLVFGFLITLISIYIFPPGSSLSSFYSIFGGIVALIGFPKLTKKLEYYRRVVLNFGFFIIFVAILFLLDYINVKLNDQAPRFSKDIVTIDKTIFYDTPFYDVYRCNINSDDEYWTIEKNSKYDNESIINYCKK